MCRTLFTFPLRSLPAPGPCSCATFRKPTSYMEHTKSNIIESLLISLSSSLLRDEHAVCSTLSTTFFSLPSWAVASTSVFSAFFVFFLICSNICTHITLSSSEKARFIFSLSSVHPAIENSSEQILYKYISAGCELDFNISFAFPSILVCLIRRRCCRTMLIALITASGSVAKTRGKCSLWNRDSSNSSYPSQSHKK